jgi:tetratricopeptide (TPR) repeat protein
VATALLGSCLTAWASPLQAPVLSAAQKEKLEERDKIDQHAKTLRAQCKTADAIQAAERMLAIECEVLDQTSEDAILSLKMLAELNEAREDWTAARKAFTELLDSWTQKLGKDSAEFTEARWGLERLEALARMSDRDRRRLKEAIEFERQGRELLGRGKVDEAVAALRQAPPIRKELMGERTSGYVIDLTNLGRVYEDQGKLEEARRCFRQALEMRQALYPKEQYPRGDLMLVVCLVDLGQLSARAARFREAHDYFQRGREMNEALNPGDHPDLPSIMSFLALVHEAEGNHGLAEKYFQQAVQTYRARYPGESYPQVHPHLATGLTNLGEAAHRMGNDAAAWPLLNQALKMSINLEEFFVSSALSSWRASSTICRLHPDISPRRSCATSRPSPGTCRCAAVWPTSSAVWPARWMPRPRIHGNLFFREGRR